jgi:glycosyltransferase involved in cell wall biosynthesis
VVTPTYNQGQFIEKTIDSVLSQGYPNLEFIIIDGGSKDNTVEVIKKYEKHLTYWVSEPDRGQSHAINKGMAIATGDYLTWLNSDDWYLPGAVIHMIELFKATPDAGMLVGSGDIVDSRGKIVYHVPAPKEITLETLYSWMRGGNFMQPSSAFSRQAWIEVGPIDESVHIAMDLDLWLKMAVRGIRFITTDTMLSLALSHPNAKTTAYESLMTVDCALIITKHGGMEYAHKTLDDMAAQFEWLRSNYEIIVNNPVLKLLRPIIKRFSKEGGYWKESVPPWVKM